MLDNFKITIKWKQKKIKNIFPEILGPISIYFSYNAFSPSCPNGNLRDECGFMFNLVVPVTKSMGYFSAQYLRIYVLGFQNMRVQGILLGNVNSSYGIFK